MKRRKRGGKQVVTDRGRPVEGPNFPFADRSVTSLSFFKRC